MKLACICFTPAGERLLQRLPIPKGWQAEISRGYGQGKVALHQWTELNFAHADALLYVGATGIAVRSIAPHLRSKATDPAVIVMDEAGRFVIPLLSGHIGGANRLAALLAEGMGATQVITTATDVNGILALDDWAAANGLHIANPGRIKRVAARQLKIAETNAFPLRLHSDVAIDGELPADIALSFGAAGADIIISPFNTEGEALHIIPPCIAVGIGCRRGASEHAIARTWEHALQQANTAEQAICGIYSIDIKKDEPGLLAFCQSKGMRLETYTAGQLARVEGSAASSDFVRQATGVDNVCERAALLGGGRLLLGKTALDGVTVALAIRDAELTFGE